MAYSYNTYNNMSGYIYIYIYIYIYSLQVTLTHTKYITDLLVLSDSAWYSYHCSRFSKVPL